MIISKVEVHAAILGAEFANMTAETQAKFFAGMAYELKSWDSAYKNQFQFATVADFLTKEEKDILKNALEILWFENEKGK